MSAGARIGDATLVIPVEGYLGPMWHAARRDGVSASEIAAVVGLSRYDSRFNLWWHKRLPADEPWEGNAATRRGRRIEPLILEDFTDDHPEFSLLQVGLLKNVERPWQLATPDAVAFEGHGPSDPNSWRYQWASEGERAKPVAVIEAKTAGGREGFGEPGTDAIPDDYRCQVLWQMDTLGVRTAYVPVWFGFDYREYVVEWDEADVKWLRAEAIEFLRTLDENEPPPIDAHDATTERLKKLHPTVKDGTTEVDPHVVRQYLAAQRLRDCAEQRMTLAENRLRDQIGDYAVAVVPDPDAKGGVRKVASRSVYDVPPAVIERGGYTVNRLNVTKPRRTR